MNLLHRLPLSTKRRPNMLYTVLRVRHLLNGPFLMLLGGWEGSILLPLGHISNFEAFVRLLVQINGQITRCR